MGSEVLGAPQPDCRFCLRLEEESFLWGVGRACPGVTFYHLSLLSRDPGLLDSISSELRVEGRSRGPVTDEARGGRVW